VETASLDAELEEVATVAVEDLSTERLDER
jgi:hypothetical protein